VASPSREKCAHRFRKDQLQLEVLEQEQLQLQQLEVLQLEQLEVLQLELHQLGASNSRSGMSSISKVSVSSW